MGKKKPIKPGQGFAWTLPGLTVQLCNYAMADKEMLVAHTVSRTNKGKPVAGSRAVHVAIVPMEYQKNLYAALAACIEELEHSQPPEGGYTESVIRQARAALAKARGE